jgi:ribosomal protein S18 acetylase RimI-like enzyme
VVSVSEAVISRGLLVIQAVATRADRRRLGAARAVLGALVTLARERSLPQLCLAVQETNSSARALYESLGFAVDHRCRYLFRAAAD